MGTETIGGGRIQDLDIAAELKQSYLRYAMSVIVDRALPDVRDGLKPSQRRILVAMNDLNLSPSRRTLKCAKVVGETMGNYHPHGDSAIYPTLVRMAQPFNMRVPLVEGQGNFGSIDPDPPASMRYTECRLTQAGVDMLADLDKETVDFRPNFDESREEPIVLPGAFPNLLVNGGSGIAVAMASSIPPHNPGEVADAIVAYLDDPDVTVVQLMEHLPGPDLPTGGRICGRQAILDAYTTGRGVLEMRARCEVLETERGGAQIVVHDIPYQVGKNTLIKKIADVAKSDRVAGISDVRDESDANVRIVISLKRGEDPDVVLNQLYKFTPLRDSLSVIMIALVDGRPVLCSIKQLVEEYARHRREVVRRRTRYLLRKAEDRHHLVAGLLQALDLIDEIVALIRASHEPAEARDELMRRFEFTRVQADAILQMRLQRLTGLQRQELEAEREDLEGRITEYRRILSDEKNVIAIVRDEVLRMKERYADPRRTTIEDTQEDYSSLDLIAPMDVVVTLSHAGYIKRTELDAYRRQRRGGKGLKGGPARAGDVVEHLYVANTHDLVFFFTDRGKVYKEHVFALPELGRYSKGRAAVNFLAMDGDERICSMLPLRELDEERSIFFVTRRGVVKRTRLADYRNIHRGGIIATQLREGDALIGTGLVGESDHVVLVTAQGMSIRFAVDEVRAMGRQATGVRGIQLRQGDRVVGMAICSGGESDGEGTLLTVCSKGYAKRTGFSEYRPQSRAGLGLRNLSRDGLNRNGEVVAARTVHEGDEVLLVTESGKTIRMTVDASQFRVMGRATAGVKAIDVPGGDRLVSMAALRPDMAEGEAATDVDEVEGDAPNGAEAGGEEE